jgi:hypothetical protein
VFGVEFSDKKSVWTASAAPIGAAQYAKLMLPNAFKTAFTIRSMKVNCGAGAGRT